MSTSAVWDPADAMIRARPGPWPMTRPLLTEAIRGSVDVHCTLTCSSAAPLLSNTLAESASSLSSTSEVDGASISRLAGTPGAAGWVGGGSAGGGDTGGSPLPLRGPRYTTPATPAAATNATAAATPFLLRDCWAAISPELTSGPESTASEPAGVRTVGADGRTPVPATLDSIADWLMLSSGTGLRGVRTLSITFDEIPDAASVIISVRTGSSPLLPGVGDPSAATTSSIFSNRSSGFLASIRITVSCRWGGQSGR